MMTTHSGIGVRRRLGAAVLAVVMSSAVLTGLVHVQPAHADVSFDQKMLELVNQQRAAAGVAPLQWSDSLGAAAEDAPYNGCGFTVQGRAADMGLRNYFSHNILGCLTQNVFNLLGGLGIVSSSSAENIAWMNGTTDPSIAAQRLITDLMASPGHKANILDATFTHIGIGSWHTVTGQTWSGGGTALSNVWITAQIFGRMTVAPAPSVAVSPSSLAFGDRALGATSSPQSINVKNQGNASLNVSGVSITGTNATDFRISANTCGSVAAAASCSISTTFSPSSAGARAATLQISDSAAGSPHAVSLSGNGTAPVPALPGTPLNVHVSAADAQIAVSWSSGPGPSADGYVVNLFDADGYPRGQQQVCGTCLSTTFIGLTNGKAYAFNVYGHNAAGWSSPAYSAWITIIVVKPGAPTGLEASHGNGQITEKWVAPTTQGAAIDGYGMYVYDSNGYTGKSAWVCATCLTASVAGLTNGTSYYAMIYAHNALGWGNSATSDWATPGTPGPLTNLTVVPGSRSVSVSWTAATDFGAPLDLHWIFTFDANGVQGPSLAVCGTCAGGTITGLVSGKVYTVWVVPHNAVGWGLYAISKPFTVG